MFSRPGQNIGRGRGGEGGGGEDEGVGGGSPSSSDPNSPRNTGDGTHRVKIPKNLSRAI